MVAKKKASIPLQEMLKAIDTNDFDFYSRLDEEQKKAFSPWLAMRYASSAKGMAAYHYLLHVNDIVNVEFSTFNPSKEFNRDGHPELQWKLLAVCGQGKTTYHPYIPPGKKKTISKLHKFLQELNPLLNSDEVNLLLAMNDKDDMILLAQNHGYSDKEIKELFK